MEKPNLENIDNLEIPIPFDVEFKEQSKKTINQVEQYVFYLLRRHTEYLISSLALTQYPPDVLRKKTEEFINEVLK